MNIYTSGISGTGMGALALMAKEAGFSVYGSDLAEGAVSGELFRKGIPFRIGEQDGQYLQEIYDGPGVDWFVYTSALPDNHPELVLARKLGLRVSKRDELIAFLIDKLGLRLVAVAGTHGKTTTTAMIIWGCLELSIPISYLVGTTLPFAGAGSFEMDSKFMVYEADEYDRNFLHFSPWLAVLPAVSYDHPDIYPTIEDYRKAFAKFRGQSEEVVEGASAVPEEIRAGLTLPGKLRREDAGLAAVAISRMLEELGRDFSVSEIVGTLNRFPGVGRRFEEIAPGVYSDYAHHPEEISATLEMATEEASRKGFSGVVVVYEPHQNTRQHQMRGKYSSVFSEGSQLKRVFWLSTYLTRENPELPVIMPEEFVEELGLENVEVAKTDDSLAKKLRELREQGNLILLMTAGSADGWLRRVFG